ncbi:polysaccharide pyruvyl transferase family protein [Vibrio diabolicus]|uniref:polysaccharide pyruvyl transferase family protein n=1 Tax=Vibrio diabolicus TaxID=50719 RepID=UPI001245CC7E|nr:polysaccharide pyruvyl transferase family protein [Vibrio diabolicus]KAB0321852.1 polysaccharide pyruvyl transferase family protein [Vibrio diabolicus]MCR9497724.1 polysaccharide pyruvyl transferase family protein [Vibrio alginolyticus]
MKKVLIIPACTDLNRGDQALVWEAAYLLEDAIDNEEKSIAIVDYGMNDKDRARQSKQTKDAGFKVIRNIVENPKRVNYKKHDSEGVHASPIQFLKAGLMAIFDLFRHSLLLVFPVKIIFNLLFPNKEHREAFDYIKDSDFFVVKGGGFLHTYGKIEDLYYLWFGLYYILLAKRLGKKTILLPNSVGPITGKLNRLFIKYVFNKIDLVYAREDISIDCLKSIGVKKAKFGYDLGYYSQSDEVTEKNKHIIDDKDKLNVGITLRPYRFPGSNNPSERYENYINSIADFCNKRQFKFKFIVQVQGPSAHETDLIAINDVIERLDESVDYEVIDADRNYKQMLSIYSSLDFLIGTRFHSVIFAQISNVPSLAIAYGGNKTRGIMRKIDLEKYVIDIESITYDELDLTFESLVSNNIDYLEKLRIAKINIENDRVKMISDIRGLL